MAANRTDGERWKPDASLIDACNRGDDRAWEMLVRRYRRLIFSIPVSAFKMREPDAEEIFQQVLVKLFENVSRLRKVESLPAWIVTVTRNECRRFFRGSIRWQPVEIDEAGPFAEDPPDVVQSLHAIECEHRLALAFQRLDDKSRALLFALYVEQPTPSYAELAIRFGRPIGSLGPTKARALKKLRRIYLGMGCSETDHAGAQRREEAPVDFPARWLASLSQPA